MLRQSTPNRSYPGLARPTGAILVALLVIGSGCSNAGEGALSGAALGAGAGAVIGSFFGSAGTGAAVGAVGGALGGGVIGDQNDRHYSQSSRGPRTWSEYRDCNW